MVDVTVSSSKISQTVNVVIPNASAFGPQEAIAAVRIAGSGTPATVVGHGKGYRVTGNKSRRACRLTAEEEYDAGLF